MRLRSTLSCLATLAFASAPSFALPNPTTKLVLPAEHGQQALAVGASESALLVAKACAKADTCSTESEGVIGISVPEEAQKLAARGVKVEAKELAGGRHLARVTFGKEGEATWVALIAAPLAGKGDAPITLWSGFTGAATGTEGEGKTSAIVEEPLAKGTRIVVGELREDVTICGRPALVAAREVDPETMTLKRGASVLSLSATERAAATKITAQLVASPKPRPVVPLFAARTASSAVGKAIGTLTDGDPDTTWSEAKPGSGRGELVTFSASSDVPVSAIELVVRPKSTEVPEGAAPKRFWLATPDKLFEVTMPEDAWRKAGAQYEVKLPAEIAASCFSIVLDEAFAPATNEKARVTIAEVTARTAFDESTPEALVGALAGGGARSKAAAAMLERAGEAAIPAIVGGYEKLDDAGRQLADGVIDAAPCVDQAPFYARIFGERLAVRSGKSKAEARAAGEDRALAHAEDRLRRCGRASAPALAELVAKHDGIVKVRAAAELALVAPSEAVPVLVDALATPNDAERYEIRLSLAHAAKSDRALAALGIELEPARFSGRTEAVRVDVLRALGPRIGDVPGAAEAFASLAVPDAPFRLRYLLQGPAAELARAGDAKAEAYLLASLRKDADAHVRLRAAEVAARAPKIQAALIEAADDPEVRVRLAAVQSLGAIGRDAGSPSPSLVAVLARRLAKDPFTFVRTHAARALGEMPGTKESDVALVAALADVSSEVRARALDGLGAHRATQHLRPIREIAQDDEADPEVRARAILALAAMCDTSLVDAWTKLAQRVAYAVDDSERTVGAAAIAALGDVKPKDLAKRLAVLLDERAPRSYREMARAALEAEPKCK